MSAAPTACTVPGVPEYMDRWVRHGQPVRTASLCAQCSDHPSAEVAGKGVLRGFNFRLAPRFKSAPVILEDLYIACPMHGDTYCALQAVHMCERRPSVDDQRHVYL